MLFTFAKGKKTLPTHGFVYLTHDSYVLILGFTERPFIKGKKQIISKKELMVHVAV